MLSFHRRLRFQSDLFPSGLTTILYEFLISPMRATLQVYLILLDFITLISGAGLNSRAV